MDTVQNGTKQLNPKQELFARYEANMHCDAEGNKVSMDEFAKLINVDRKTLYEWRKMDGWNDIVAEYVDDVYLRFLPKAAKINMAYATKGSFPHMNLIYKQSGKLKADKQEIRQELTVDAALDSLN